MPETTQNEVIKLYRTDINTLRSATTTAFTFTAGIIIGLIAADKALTIRQDSAKIDSRNKFSGSLIERRIDPIIYGVQAASYAGILFGLAMSVTFFSSASFDQAIQLISFAILGGIIAGIIHQEGSLWLTFSYAILVFFTSLILIFQTGNHPEFAFAIILQLFIIPIPFIVYLSFSFHNVLQKNNLTNKDWMYDIFPLMAFYSLYLVIKRKKLARLAYEKEILDELPMEVVASKIVISKDFLKERGSLGYNLARHYFELLMSYTASYEEDKFILIPTAYQLENWWCEKANQKPMSEHIDLLNYVDKMLWDPLFEPSNSDLVKYEALGKEMVLTIQ